MMSKEKQIEEMAEIMRHSCEKECRRNKYGEFDCEYCEAELLYNAGYRKQSEGKWEWFEVWSPSTPEHPGKCNDCGWECSRCKVALRDMVGGYWYDASTMPELPFCPNCGARMGGGEE